MSKIDHIEVYAIGHPEALKCDMRVAVLYAGDSTGLTDDCLTTA
jgi:hypothetical protein